MFTIEHLSDLMTFLDRNTPASARPSRFCIRTTNGTYCGEWVDTHWTATCVGLRMPSSATGSHTHVVYIVASTIIAVNIIGQEEPA